MSNERTQLGQLLLRALLGLTLCLVTSIGSGEVANLDTVAERHAALKANREDRKRDEANKEQLVRLLTLVASEVPFDWKEHLPVSGHKRFSRLSREAPSIDKLLKVEDGKALNPALEDVFSLSTERWGRCGLASLFMSATFGALHDEENGEANFYVSYDPDITNNSLIFSALAGLYCIDYAAFQLVVDCALSKRMSFTHCELITREPDSTGRRVRGWGTSIMSTRESIESLFARKRILQRYEAYLQTREH
ncbi:MAG: hypothetical protein ACI8TQ_000501 [Planctomycetota bacterium]|jgi:hypothetical protein